MLADEERQEIGGGLVGCSDLCQSIPIVLYTLIGGDAENQQEDEEDQKGQCAGLQVPGYKAAFLLGILFRSSHRVPRYPDEDDGLSMNLL